MTKRIPRERAPRASRAASRRIKIAVTLPRDQVDKAKRAVDQGLAPSVSAYVAQALEHREGADALAELVATMRAEDGRPSEEDYAWADSALGLRQTRPKHRA